MKDYENKVKAVMASWPWRIKRLGYTIQDFAATFDIGAPMFSEYTSGKTIPSAVRYMMIEGTLSDVEIERGLKEADGR